MRKIAYFLSFLFLLSGSTFGQEILTLEEFIKTSITSHPRYRISAQEYLIALETNKSEKSIEDWNLIVSAVFQEATPAPLSAISADYQKSTGYSVGVKRYLAQTGTDIKLEHRNTRITAKYPSLSIPGVDPSLFYPDSPYYISDLSLTITQPLLQNAFGLHKKNRIKIADYSLDLAQIKLGEDWEDFITGLRQEYLDWQRCHLNVKIFRDKVKTVENQMDLVKKQIRYGLSEELEMVQIRQKLQSYNILLEQAKMACETQTKRIIRIMGKPELKAEAVQPQELAESSEVYPETSSLSYLNQNSNLRRTADLLVLIQETNLETKSDEELLDMKLSAQYRPNAYAKGFGESLSRIGDQSEYTITLNASRDLPNQKAEAEASKAEEEYRKALKEKEDVLLNAEISLSNLYTNLHYLNRMLELNQNNLKLAKERLSLEQKKFNQGRSSIFFVLQAEDDLLQAESTRYETIFAREKVINQIKSFTDRYLAEYESVLKL
ncbi:hypothetical protein AMJ44_06210 [candidate division WOR-1 bacterium DG_54_3]|uniref:TolC family protein n=1 Tax=candidate division WOR-1 bacterium DG_54_3 TaxID=1703775 RepID=A0A0S7Y1F8_UNCSA|nr:MAG: hypothetical protein AMJ44_06210 [candidate division WOR-1 bacterium DG_54_3]